MAPVLLIVLLSSTLLAGLLWWRRTTVRRARLVADAEADARRWYERLGGELTSLGRGDCPAAAQALADAGERYTAAGSQLARARAARQYELAGQTALEGLAYARAARVALGLGSGPELPALVAARRAGALTKERTVDVRGQVFTAGPQPGSRTPYYFPGGPVHGRPVPAGWYSQPMWRSSTASTAASVVGTMLVFDALFSPDFADPDYGSEAAGGETGDASGDHGGVAAAGAHEVGGGNAGDARVNGEEAGVDGEEAGPNGEEAGAAGAGEAGADGARSGAGGDATGADVAQAGGGDAASGGDAGGSGFGWADFGGGDFGGGGD